MKGKLGFPDPERAVADRQPAQWLDVDPPEDAPHRRSKTHSDSLPGEEGWFVIGASVRGRLHAHEGTFREDAFAIDHAAGWHLIAVADGAGSHSLSRVGSEEAVRTSVGELRTRLEACRDRSEGSMRLALEEALRASWQALSRKAGELGAEFRDLGTTLLLLAHHPQESWVGVAQIGDGLLAAQLEDGTIQVLGRPESGEYSGQTLFLTNHKESDLASRVDITSIEGLAKLFLVMTDGVADDFYPPKERLPGLIKALPDVLSSDDAAQSLTTLINYERPGSFDDRTLVILCRREALLGSRESDATSPSEGPIEPAGFSEVSDNGSHPR